MNIRTWMRNLSNTVIPEILTAQGSDRPGLFVPSRKPDIEPIYDVVIPKGDEAEANARLGMIISPTDINGFHNTTSPYMISASSKDVGFDAELWRQYRIEYAEAKKSGKKLPEPPEPQLTAPLAIRTVNKLGNVGTQSPPIDVPADRFNRATLALNYYKNDAIANPAIRALVEFVIGPGFEIEVDYGFEETPEWFDVGAPWVASIMGKSPGRKGKDRDKIIFNRYLAQQAKDLKENLNLEPFALELSRDAIVTGDGVGYRVDDIQNPGYIDNREPKAEIDFLFNNPAKIQSINPLSMEVEMDAFAEIVSYTFKPMGSTGGQGGKKVTGDDLAKVIRLKWGGSGWSLYGESILGPVLGELQLKDSLLNAMKISADRFIVPVKIARFGEHHSGPDGGPIATPAMRDDLAEILRTHNPRSNQWIMGPYHWSFEYLGTENGLLSVASEVKENNARILQGIGLPPNFLDSSYTSFATAKIQFANLLLRLRLLQLATARALEDGILKPWAEMRGFRDPIGNLVKFKIIWRKVNLEGDPEMLSTIRTLAVSSGQEVLSNATMTTALGFNADQEAQQLELEFQQSQERMEEMGLGPGQQVDENGNPIPPSAPTKPGLKGPGTPNERGMPEDDASQLPAPKRKKGPAAASNNSVGLVVAELRAQQQLSTNTLVDLMHREFEEIKQGLSNG